VTGLSSEIETHYPKHLIRNGVTVINLCQIRFLT